MPRNFEEAPYLSLFGEVTNFSLLSKWLHRVSRQWRQKPLQSAGLSILRRQSLCQQQHATETFYLSLGPRFARFYGTANLAQVVHNLRAADDTTAIMEDVGDSPTWSHDEGVFFQASTDGMNPFNKNKTSYSMWPISLAILNLPRQVRYLFGRLLLVGIVPGNGSKELGTLQPYLDIMVDERLTLKGQQLYDAYRRAPFTFKCSVLSYVLDYPGIGKVFHVSGSGAYRGCTWRKIRDKYILVVASDRLESDSVNLVKCMILKPIWIHLSFLLRIKWRHPGRIINDNIGRFCTIW